MNSGACTGPASSARSAVTCARQQIGSMGLWARKGAVYVRSMTCAAPRNTASGSPSLRTTRPGRAAMAAICARWSVVFSRPAGICLVRVLPNMLMVSVVSAIGSQSMRSALLAFITSQVVLPTTATISGKAFVSKKFRS